MEIAETIRQTVKIYDLAAGANRLYRLMFGERRFVPASVETDEEHAVFTYKMNGLKSVETLEKAMLVDKLRFLINVADLAALSEEFSFSLSPENLCADINLAPKILHRDLRGEENAAEFTDKYRALAGWTLRPKNTYEQYLNSGEGLYKKHKVLRKLTGCREIDEMQAVLRSAYEHELNKLKTKKRIVNAKGYRTMQVLLPIAILLFLGSGVFAWHLYFSVLPFQQTLVAAGHAFMVENYDEAIDVLRDIAPMTMPKEERYQLARAYVISESLSQEQKQHLLSDISPRTEDNILIYWISLGRLEYENAIDMAQRIGDNELQLYALLKYEVAVRNDPQLSGEEKTQTLSEISGKTEELRKDMQERENTVRGVA